ncbi:hypothetical protein [Amycolatopsis sp. NPDC051061]|uniref:hypothetical protein n=1 Tax=Amycolatopsis sp. NPDC051061 TaxID=3155042 RepID=UPI00341DC9A1
MPIAAAVVALAANHCLRNANRRGETMLIAVVTLVSIVASGAMLDVALRLARA